MYPDYLNVKSGTERETKTLGVKGNRQHQRPCSQASFHSLILGLIPRPQVIQHYKTTVAFQVMTTSIQVAKGFNFTNQCIC